MRAAIEEPARQSPDREYQLAALTAPEQQPDEIASYRGDDAPLDHIYVIMLENHSQSSVIGDPNAPYLTSLADQYGVADHYYGVTHPSMPNYLALLGGDNFWLQDDNDQNVVNLDRTNLVDQLEAHRVSWDAYLDTLPTDKLDRFGPTLPDGTTVSLYAKKHNPCVLFSDITTNRARMAHIKDDTALGTDLNSPPPRHIVSHTPYNHYSLLATIKANWRLGALGHSGDTANAVRPMWDLLPVGR